MFICALLVLARGLDIGPVTLRVNGVDRTYRLVALNESRGVASVIGPNITLGHGNASQGGSQGTRVWVANDGSMGPHSYVNFRLLGQPPSHPLHVTHKLSHDPRANTRAEFDLHSTSNLMEARA